jgi:putative transposase
MSLLSVRCKLVPQSSQAKSLGRTVDQFAAACNYVLKVARAEQAFNKFALQKLAYQDIREKFGLSANLAVRAVARVGKRKGKRTGGFKATSVDYDQRILSVKVADETISLNTVDGRLTIPLKIGGYQRHLLRTAESIQGGQLVRGAKGKWYIHLQCKFADETPKEPNGTLGVDLGVENIAADSDGNRYSSAKVEAIRQRYARHRRSLQKCGSRSAKRRLQKLSGREAYFRKNENHCVAKTLVETAKRTSRGIKLEDLAGIRERVRLRKSQRAKHHGWSFYQLRSLIEYRCVRDGVPLGLVDAAYTSRTCWSCGCKDKANRRSQAEYQCVSCGYSAHADVNAARNIARAAVKQPIVAWVEASPVHDIPQLQAPVL